MADRIYRLNLYTLADFEKQIQHFEAMAQKGWQLEKYGQSLLVYRRAEPCETHYAMTFLSDEPPKGIIASSRQILLDRAIKNGWELLHDDPHVPLQLLRSNRLAPLPVEPDPDLYRKQIAAMLSKRTDFPYGPLAALELSWLGLYDIAVPHSPRVLSLLLLAILWLLFSFADMIWTFLWKRRSKKLGRPMAFYCTPLRTACRFLLFSLSLITIGILCIGPYTSRILCMTALFLLFYGGVCLQEFLIRRYISDRKTEVRLLSALVLIILLLAGMQWIGSLTFPDDLPI